VGIARHLGEVGPRVQGSGFSASRGAQGLAGGAGITPLLSGLGVVGTRQRGRSRVQGSWYSGFGARSQGLAGGAGNRVKRRKAGIGYQGLEGLISWYRFGQVVVI